MPQNAEFEMFAAEQNFGKLTQLKRYFGQFDRFCGRAVSAQKVQFGAAKLAFVEMPNHCGGLVFRCSAV